MDHLSLHWGDPLKPLGVPVFTDTCSQCHFDVNTHMQSWSLNVVQLYVLMQLVRRLCISSYLISVCIFCDEPILILALQYNQAWIDVHYQPLSCAALGKL